MSDYMMPPSGAGKTEEQQIREIRDFLVRTVRQLNTANAAQGSTTRTETTSGKGASVERIGANATEDISVIRRQAATLKELIKKNADAVEKKFDEMDYTLESSYVAQSEFGTYKDAAALEITQTAKAINEKFTEYQTIEKANKQAESLESDLKQYAQEMEGQICRGFIRIEGEEEPYFGIAVSSKLDFVASSETESGKEEEIHDDEIYYRLAEGQSVGLYTSKGWYFFISGVKAGYFDSETGKMHINMADIDTEIQIGEYKMSATGRWGIKYTGV